MSQRLTTGLFLLLLSVLLWGFSASAVNAGEAPSSTVFQKPDQSGAVEEREYNEWERRIAQDVISTGQMLEGDPLFADVVSMIAARGQSLLPGGSDIAQGWIEDNLRQILPQLDNKMAAAAMSAAAWRAQGRRPLPAIWSS